VTLRTTVVIMAYDEAASLTSVTDEIEGVLRSLGTPYEILIVDDGSRDGTGELADRLADERDHVRGVHHTPNQGLGGVYRTGFVSARGEFVTFFPADGQFPAEIIRDFDGRMDAADMVLGYLLRRDCSLLSKALSRVERVLYGMLFGRFPRFQGILMFRRALLDGCELRSEGRGWAVLMEFILRVARTDARVVSRPTDIRPRMSGTSKVNDLRNVWSNFRQLLALRKYL
jgi:glycosyltransferase involved in cell wall biosynthesis